MNTQVSEFVTHIAHWSRNKWVACDAQEDNFDVSSAPLISCTSRAQGLLGGFRLIFTYEKNASAPVHPYEWVKISIGEEVYQVGVTAAMAIFPRSSGVLFISGQPVVVEIKLPTPDVLMTCDESIEPFWVDKLLKVQVMLPTGLQTVTRASLVYNKYVPMAISVPRDLGHKGYPTITEFGEEVGSGISATIAVPLCTLPRGILVAIVFGANAHLRAMAEVLANGQVIAFNAQTVVFSGRQQKILCGIDTENQAVLTVKFDITALRGPTEARVAFVVYQYAR